MREHYFLFIGFHIDFVVKIEKIISTIYFANDHKQNKHYIRWINRAKWLLLPLDRAGFMYGHYGNCSGRKICKVALVRFSISVWYYLFPEKYGFSIVFFFRISIVNCFFFWQITFFNCFFFLFFTFKLRFSKIFFWKYTFLIFFFLLNTYFSFFLFN